MMSCNPTLNYGGASHVHVINDSGCIQRGLLAFELSNLPRTGTVLAATLQLWTHSTGNMSTDAHTLHRVNEAWVEGTGDDLGNVGGASWNERDAAVPWTSAGCGAPSCEDTVIGTIQFVNTSTSVMAQAAIELATVQGWVDGTVPNHGIQIRSTGATLASSIETAEGVDGTRPTLVLTVLTAL